MPIFKLVDGQQRLTTISILLKSLSLVLGGEDPFRRRIQRFLLNDEQGELAFQLLPTKKHGDRDAFTRIINDGEFLEENRPRICEAFVFFQTELKKRMQEGIRPDGLLTVLTTSFKVVFINLETSESPYRIFESLNAKGKPSRRRTSSATTWLCACQRGFRSGCLRSIGAERKNCFKKVAKSVESGS